MSTPTAPESSPAHQPYVPDRVAMPEFTWPAVLVGAVLGIIFGASSLYLVLKVGMTVSASIPVAVLSITLFRVFSRLFGFRRATILENNIVQTTGSAGESIAFGVGVTMPAVMILGFEMEIARVMVVSVLGGILGILMMIPLRRAFIVKQHGTLKYPEGTACADVLIIGETGGSSAKTVFAGFGVAFAYQVLWGGLKLWKEVASRPLDWFKGATPAMEVNPALLGVGYIIGTRIACIMVAGGGWSLSAMFNWVNLVAAVLIVLFGFLFVTVSSRLTGEIGSSSNPISGMTIATLLLTCLIFLTLGWTDSQYRLIALSIAAVVCIASSNGGTTSQDLKTGYLVGATPKWQQWSILVGSISSALVIGAILMALNSTGTVYSKSPKNLPTLTQPLDMAKLNAASQRERAPGDDAWYYVWHPVEGNPEGASPGKYLVDEQGKIHYLVDPGICGKLKRRDDGVEVKKFNPPQAQLFALITNGILTQKLQWVLVLLGVSITVVMELCHVSSLAFAVGVYLPLSSSAPIFVGGLVRYVVEKLGRKKGDQPESELESEMSTGMLFSTGYIAGGSIAGVIVTFLALSETLPNTLAVWQYRTMPAPAAASFDAQCRALAKEELGANASQKQLERTAAEIRDLNEAKLRLYVRVPKGTTLNLPENQRYEAPADAALIEVAEQALGSGDKASLLFDLNENRLKLPERLPAGVLLKIPQRNAPALIAFALLAVLLAAVGVGWIMKPSTA